MACWRQPPDECPDDQHERQDGDGNQSQRRAIRPPRRDQANRQQSGRRARAANRAVKQAEQPPPCARAIDQVANRLMWVHLTQIPDTERLPLTLIMSRLFVGAPCAEQIAADERVIDPERQILTGHPLVEVETEKRVSKGSQGRLTNEADEPVVSCHHVAGRAAHLLRRPTSNKGTGFAIRLRNRRQLSTYGRSRAMSSIRIVVAGG